MERLFELQRARYFEADKIDVQMISVTMLKNGNNAVTTGTLNNLSSHITQTENWKRCGLPKCLLKFPANKNTIVQKSF